MDEYYYTTIPSPVGELTLVASHRALVGIVFPKDKNVRRDYGVRQDKHPVLARAKTELAEYFAGRRKSFDVPLAPAGTVFQLKAWRALTTIPYGRTVSYGEQARAMGDANKARAVGMANGRNPLPIVVPCHRVIGANGALTGFGGGLKTKAYLLELERKYG